MVCFNDGDFLMISKKCIMECGFKKIKCVHAFLRNSVPFLLYLDSLFCDDDDDVRINDNQWSLYSELGFLEKRSVGYCFFLSLLAIAQPSGK